ncbi:alpha/beta hydrolase [Thermoflavimicrobium daqui]|uniref:Alpha/beta hydrolase n=1 Tax=Thermoflavimicrobium daqui TaxID=2137476 RepID=A0A364K4K6_9BACL|nr:alpha/beta hydrolase [Thermoflavimicrobium daqui]RAL24293.1 alpha/beta hydrolase [Thermoflavimicrobium daqui]
MDELTVAIVIIIFLIITLLWYNHNQIKQAEAKFPPTGKFVTIEGIKLHYISEGSGKPIVFLHGGVLTGDDFRKVIKLAVKQGYHTIAFDRPGYGYSERPKSEDATPMVQARLLHHALKKLGVERPMLVGHSWSGILVLSYALSYPDNLSGMIILGGAMYKEGYPAEHGDPISKIVTTPILGDALLHMLITTPIIKGLARNILKETFTPEPVPADYYETAVALWLRPNHFKANREDVLFFAPTAVVVGENDPFGVQAQAKRLKRDMPHAKLITLPNVAHMIPQNHPQLVMDVVHTFISEQELTKTATF